MLPKEPFLNMKYFNLKHLSVAVIINYISLILVLLLTKYIFAKVKIYYQTIQSFTENLNNIGSVLQNNASIANYNDLNSNLSIISQMANNIIFWLIILFSISFLIYIISQSISWNLLITNLKLKNYKTYLKKFIILSIPFGVILFFLTSKTIIRARPFILDFWFKNYFNAKELIIILLLSLLILAIYYIYICLLIWSNKNSIRDSFKLLKKEYKKISKTFVHFLLATFISSTLFIWIARINKNSIIILMISLFVFLIINNVFKVFLTKKIENLK